MRMTTLSSATINVSPFKKWRYHHQQPCDLFSNLRSSRFRNIFEKHTSAQNSRGENRNVPFLDSDPAISQAYLVFILLLQISVPRAVLLASSSADEGLKRHFVLKMF